MLDDVGGARQRLGMAGAALDSVGARHAGGAGRVRCTGERATEDGERDMSSFFAQQGGANRKQDS